MGEVDITAFNNYEPLSDFAKRCFEAYPIAVILKVHDDGQVLFADPNAKYDDLNSFAYCFKCYPSELRAKN